MNDVENGMLDYSENEDIGRHSWWDGCWYGGWGRHDDDEPFAIYDPD